MLKHVLTGGHDHLEWMRAPAGSVLSQEPAHRLLCRALELLRPSELELRTIDTLVTDEPCGSGVRDLHALLAELGERNGRQPSTSV
jgi:hypothetical protein